MENHAWLLHTLNNRLDNLLLPIEKKRICDAVIHMEKV